MTRLSWDEYGVEVAKVVALRAACTRRQVGAVILNPDHRIVATGYNGTASGETHCSDGGCPRGQYSHAEIPPNLGNAGHGVRCVAQHAERNAIDYVLKHHELDYEAAVSFLSVCTLYITCAPCPDCAAAADLYGLRVVWP